MSGGLIPTTLLGSSLQKNYIVCDMLQLDLSRAELVDCLEYSPLPGPRMSSSLKVHSHLVSGGPSVLSCEAWVPPPQPSAPGWPSAPLSVGVIEGC